MLAASKKQLLYLRVFYKLIDEIPQFNVEYAKILTADRLEEFDAIIDQKAVFAVAAYLGDVRLIDNIELG